LQPVTLRDLSDQWLEPLSEEFPTGGIPQYGFSGGKWNHRLADSNCWYFVLIADTAEVILNV